MKKLLIFSTVCLLISTSLFAQTFSRKLGKVTKDELEMTVYDKAPDAEAVILYEDIDMHYEVSDKIRFVYEYKIKIKILKKEGATWGDKEIMLYNRGSSDEYLSGLKATAYNLVDGKIVESELKKDYIFKEKIDEKRTMTKFSIPEVKVGTVIEYKYRITSDYIFSIPDINVQHSIPVMYCKFNVDVPEYFKFRLNVKGYHRLNIKRTGGNSNSGGYSFITDVVSCETEHIPALKDDSNVWCLNDFRTKVEFELSSIQIPGQIVRNYANNWQSVNEALEKSDFNSDLKTSYPFKKEVLAIKESSVSDREKLRNILKLVQSKMKWNETYSLLSKSPRSAAEKGTGSSADINFVLHSALRDAGFDIVPILLNPRNKGRLPLAQATLDNINTFIIRVTLDGEFLFVDGTNPHSDINVLPSNLLVDRARVYKVNDDRSGWVNLTNLAQNTSSSVLIGGIDESGILSGTIKKKYTNQSAYSFANKYESYKTKEEYIESVEKEDGMKVESLEIEGLDSLAITETIKFSLTTNSTDEYIYLNSLVFPFISENPLKQQERILPVEFNYPINYNISCIITIPENYTLEEKPDNIKLSACENGIKYSYLSQQTLVNLQMKFTYSLDRIIYPSNEYKDLSAFYGMLTQMSGSQIVIKKNQ
ncbi:MAG: DUF3857 domain-containing protein [Prevotellaceae bacterium]|jgi:hypothetical protein|nr:DUF3857 domain-containing protein [Prevotellaceae bacterium]